MRVLLPLTACVVRELEILIESLCVRFLYGLKEKTKEIKI
jgi:hypothetical protein